jgi:prepilin peptidase CpaA
MTYPPPAIQALLLLIVIPAAIFDILSRRIPNWLSFAGVVFGVGLNVFLYQKAGLWASLEGIGLALAVYFVLYLLRGMGAGDVKLMAAVGATAGPTNWSNWLGILFLTAMVGAVVGIGMVLTKGRLRKTFDNVVLILMSLRSGQAPYRDHPELDVRSSAGVRLPHAAMIAMGTIGFIFAARIWAPR